MRQLVRQTLADCPHQLGLSKSQDPGRDQNSNSLGDLSQRCKPGTMAVLRAQHMVQTPDMCPRVRIHPVSRTHRSPSHPGKGRRGLKRSRFRRKSTSGLSPPPSPEPWFDGGGSSPRGRKLFTDAHGSSNVPSTLKCSSDNKRCSRVCSTIASRNYRATSTSNVRCLFLENTEWSKLRSMMLRSRNRLNSRSYSSLWQNCRSLRTE